MWYKIVSIFQKKKRQSQTIQDQRIFALQVEIGNLKQSIWRYASDMQLRDDVKWVIECYKLGTEQLNKLFAVYKVNNIPDEPDLFVLAEQFFPNRLEEAIEHSFQIMLEKANSLKTDRGKSNRYRRFLEELSQHEADLPPELSGYISDLKTRINALITE
jgi:hypothetical protein